MTNQEKLVKAIKDGIVVNDKTALEFAMREKFKETIAKEVVAIPGSKGDKGDQGEPGKDGINGQTPVIDTAKITSEASNEAYNRLLPNIPTIQQISLEIPQLGSSIRDSLELLSGEERLDSSAIKNLPELIQKNNEVVLGGYGGLNLYVGGSKIGATKTINFEGMTFSEINGMRTITATGGLTKALADTYYYPLSTNPAGYYKSGDNATFGTLGAGAITGTSLGVSGDITANTGQMLAGGFYVGGHSSMNSGGISTTRGIIGATLAATAAGGLTLGTQTTANIPGFISLISAGANLAWTTTFTAGTQTANADYTLPTASANGLLKNASGVLSWDTATYLPLAGGTMTGDILLTGTVNLGATGTRFTNIWGTTITGTTLADGTATITGGLGTFGEVNIGQVGDTGTKLAVGTTATGTYTTGYPALIEFTSSPAYPLPTTNPNMLYVESSPTISAAAPVTNLAGQFWMTPTGVSSGSASQSKIYYGLFGGAIGNLTKDTTRNYSALIGLSFSVFNAGDWIRASGGGNPSTIITQGINITTQLGYTGKTISGALSGGTNYGGIIATQLAGSYASTNAGTNYGLNIQTSDNLTAATTTGNITSYSLYIAGLTESTKSGGGVITAWDIYQANANNNALAGNTSIGMLTAPTAKLNLGAGTTTASTAPLKFTSGIDLETAEAGAMEYDGTNLHFTAIGTLRENIMFGVRSSGTLTAGTTSTITNANAKTTSTIIIQPTSAAITLLGVYVSTKNNGTFILTHGVAAGTETFDFIIIN